MSEFYNTNGTVSLSHFDRDMMLANAFGKRAANFETNQPGILAGSYRARDDFKRAVLARYDVRTWPNRDESASYVLSLRKALNEAYYGHHVSDAYVNPVNSEIVGFDPPGEIYVNGEEIEIPELISA